MASKKQKTSPGVAFKNIYAEYSDDFWNIFTHRNDDTYSVTDQKVAKKLKKYSFEVKPSPSDIALEQISDNWYIIRIHFLHDMGFT